MRLDNIQQNQDLFNPIKSIPKQPLKNPTFYSFSWLLFKKHLL